MEPAVARFPLTKDMALRRVKSVAADSKKIFVPKEFSEHGQWFQRVTQRQVALCLTDGAITRDPRPGALHFWECQMERFSAGLLVTVDFAIGPVGDDACGIVVLKVTAE